MAIAKKKQRLLTVESLSTFARQNEQLLDSEIATSSERDGVSPQPTPESRQQQAHQPGFNFGQTALFAAPIQRQTEEDSGEEDPAQLKTETMSSPSELALGNSAPISLAPRERGLALAEPVRGKMENAFNTDFSDVRIHEGEAAEQINAVAYTQGSHIHFQPGKYQPESTQGQQLIGHELTHVVQQRAGRVDRPQGKHSPINTDNRLEAEADQLGTKAARGASVQVTGMGRDIQRFEATPQADAGGKLSEDEIQALIDEPDFSQYLKTLRQLLKEKKITPREWADIRIKRGRADDARMMEKMQAAAADFRAGVEADFDLILAQYGLPKADAPQSSQSSEASTSESDTPLPSEAQPVAATVAPDSEKVEAASEKTEKTTETALVKPEGSGALQELTVAAFRKAMGIGRLSSEGATLKAIQSHLKRLEAGRSQGVTNPTLRAVAFEALETLILLVGNYIAKHGSDTSKTGKKRLETMKTLRDRLLSEKAASEANPGGQENDLQQGAQEVVGDPTKGLTLNRFRDILKLGKLSSEGKTLKEIQAEVVRYEELKQQLTVQKPRPSASGATETEKPGGVDPRLVQAYFCLNNIEREIADYKLRHEADSSSTQRKRSVRINTLLVMAQAEQRSLSLLAGADLENVMTPEQREMAEVEAEGRYQKLREKVTCKPKEFVPRMLKTVIDKGLPTPGGYNQVEIMVNIPITTPIGIVLVGGRIFNHLDRDDNGNLTTMRSEFGLSSGYHVPFFTFKGTFSGYVESKANAPERLANLWVYGLYQRMRQSEIVPENLTNLLYGHSTGNVGFAAAEDWAAGIEEDVFGSSQENTLEERQRKLAKVDQAIASLETQEALPEDEREQRRKKLEDKRERLQGQIKLLSTTPDDIENKRQEIAAAEQEKTEAEVAVQQAESTEDDSLLGGLTTILANDEVSAQERLEAATHKLEQLQAELENLENPLEAVREQRKHRADKKWKAAEATRKQLRQQKKSGGGSPTDFDAQIAEQEAIMVKKKTQSQALDAQGESYVETGAHADLEAEVGAGPGNLGLGLRAGTGRKIDREALIASKKGLGGKRDRQKSSRKDRIATIGRGQNNITLSGSFEAGSVTGDLEINFNSSGSADRQGKKERTIDLGFAITWKQAFGGWSGILVKALMKGAEMLAKYRQHCKKDLIAKAGASDQEAEAEVGDLSSAMQNLQTEAADVAQSDDSGGTQSSILGKPAEANKKTVRKKSEHPKRDFAIDQVVSDTPTAFNATDQFVNNYGQADKEWAVGLWGGKESFASSGTEEGGWRESVAGAYDQGGLASGQKAYGKVGSHYSTSSEDIQNTSRGGDTEKSEGKLGFKVEGNFNVYKDFAADVGVFLLETSEYVIGAKTGTKASIFKAAMERGKKLLAYKRQGGKGQWISMWEESLGGSARLDKDYGFEKLNEDD